MSYIAAEGEQSTSAEILTLTNLSILPASGTGQFLRKTGLDTFENATPSEIGLGTVTTVSVVSANGLAGTVANATTTPAITLTTTITGLLKGNGTAISAASDGTDYLSSTTGLKLDQTSSQIIVNGQPIWNTLTASELVSMDANKKLQSLPVANYPSLTELSYVKGVTSGIQSQLNGKQTSMGADDNYVTNAEKVIIGNTSGTNTGDQDGSDITFTPYGDIAATNVQDAIEDLDDEKQPRNAELTALTAMTNPAGKIETPPTSTVTSVASKGGVLRNIDGAVGDTAITTDGWIENEKFGVYVDGIANNWSAEFDSAVTKTGRLTVKISTDATGRAHVYIGGLGTNLSSLNKNAFPVKPNTTYRLLIDIAGINLKDGTYEDLIIKTFSSNGTAGAVAKMKFADVSTYNFKIFDLLITTDANSAFAVIQLALDTAGNASIANIDINSISFQEVHPDTTSVTSPVQIQGAVQAITSTDNIDQSLDPTGAYANTYALTNAINEGATHIKTFTPTKKHIAKIGVWCVAKGTGNWSLCVHDSSNNIIMLASITNASLVEGAFNYFDTGGLWLSGNYHYHVYSSIADGTCKANTSNDLETASYIEKYVKKSEGATLICNGIETNLIADKDGFLNNSIIDLDKGKFNFYSTISEQNDVRASNVFSSTRSIILDTIHNYSMSGTSFTIKVNTALPIKNLKVQGQTSGAGGSEVMTMAVSKDNIVYTDIDASTAGVDKLLSGTPTNLNGQNIFYLRFTQSGGGTTYVGTITIEADLDTSAIPRGLIYPLATNQFSDKWTATDTVLSYVYRKAKYTNEYGVVMPAIELNSGATGAGDTLGFIPFKIDNSQETTPSVKILTTSGIASDTVLDADDEYVALSSGATYGKVDFQIGQGASCDPITKNILYLSSNAESVDSTQDPSHQATFTYGIKNQGVAENVKDLGLETQKLRQEFAETKQYIRNSSNIIGFDSGTTDAYSITVSDFDGYKVGLSVLFKANTVNTGACTLNINGMGAKAIVKGITTALSDADILALMWCQLVYDGTNFVILNPRAL